MMWADCPRGEVSLASEAVPPPESSNLQYYSSTVQSIVSQLLASILPSSLSGSIPFSL